MVSVFTPTHEPKFLQDLFTTLKEQTYSNWEWVIIPNNGAVIPDFKDKRVKVYPFEKTGFKIGELKNFACSKCKGDILLELDHDDLLTPDCLEEVVKAFDSDPEITMVYSNFAQVDMDFKPKTWSAYYGWEFRDFDYKGHIVKEAISPPPIPSNLGRIWYAPNHVRAWRAKDYWRIGGHDVTMKISDDHDIVARNYLYGKIHHINKCLYIYRVHGKNTWLGLTQEIEDTMWDNYVKYIFPMIEKWADENKLIKLDLCGGVNPRKGYTSIDRQNADIVADLDKKWPLKDNSVGVIYANDAVEHLKDPIHTMNEAHRVLAHGGYFMINVPSTDGRGAFCDPTHRSFWNIRSFEYYTKANMRKFIEPECKCEFQVMKLNNGTQYSDKVPYVFAHLIALKDGLRFHGAYDWYRERTTLSKGVDVPLYENARYEWAKSMVKGKTILEIGCSNGYGSQYFKGFDYLGIDNSQPIIDSAIKEYGDKFKCADIHDFKLGQYDNIVIFECLEHLEDGRELAQELKKHCKQLLASVPYNENKGDLGGHHKIHNLTEKDFPGFEYKFMRKDGKIYDSPDDGFNLILLKS
jgi:O-antigen biosynthesis protein